MMPEAPEPTSSLTSPTAVGQTQRLTKLDGAAVAACAYGVLPYHLRTAWASRVEAVRSDAVDRYLEADASPVVLRLAASNPHLAPAQRRAAAARLATNGLDDAALGRMERHLVRLLTGSRARLLKHLSVADRADPELDRLDLLAEVVALRDAQSDVSTERNLARTFRAMFRTRDPFAVWIIACVCLALFIILLEADPETSAPLGQALRLEPDLSRPWTLLTYGFVHRVDDWRHVTLNMIALVSVGQVLELVLGHARFLGAFLLCMVGAGLASVLYRITFDLPFATVGASGAISGIAGMALFLGVWFQGRYGRIPLRYTTSTLIGGLVLVSNVLIAATGFDVGVDHGAHLGGLAVGVGLGVWLKRRIAAEADARFGLARALP